MGYTYPSAGNPRPHAVTGVGSYTLGYDANGNMTGRENAIGTQTLTFDVENRLSQVQGTGGVYSGTSTYVYDGDGKRIKKTEGGNTTVYVNQYYEKDITAGVATSHYYLGGTQVAIKKGSTVEYIHQDHLNSSSLSTDSSGSPLSTMKVFSFGETRSSSGTLGTDKKYTGQRLDGTGLYFYNARYYDAGLGRFISPDPIVPNPANPQSLNRYSYVLNNPLRYIDPTGHFEREELCASGTCSDDFDQQTWGFLLEAEVGDSIEINGQTFYFYHEVEDESGPGMLRLFPTGLLIGGPTDIGALIGNATMAAVGPNIWEERTVYDRDADIRGERFRHSFRLVPTPEMTADDWIKFADSLAVAGDIPIFGVPGYVVSAISATGGYLLTTREYEKGNVSEGDMSLATTTYVIGLVPFVPVGLVSAGVQWLHDVWGLF